MVKFNGQEYEPEQLIGLKDGYRSLKIINYFLTNVLLTLDMGYIVYSMPDCDEKDFTNALFAYGVAYVIYQIGKRAEKQENRLEKLIKTEKDK